MTRPQLFGAALSGVRVTIDRFLCQPEFARWRKSHKRPRINKKWHKRYGAILKCKGHAYQVRGIGIVCCPCIGSELEKL